MESQKNVAEFYSEEFICYSDEMNMMRECLVVAGEYDMAYETIVSTLGSTFFIVAKAAIKLLESGLLLGFKTERKKEAIRACGIWISTTSGLILQTL